VLRNTGLCSNCKKKGYHFGSVQQNQVKNPQKLFRNQQWCCRKEERQMKIGNQGNNKARYLKDQWMEIKN